MTNPEKIAFKIKLKNFGLQILQRRIATAQAAMDRAQEAANTEEKSSSGDKYETGRAMGQLEKEMYGRQLAEYAKEISALQSIAADTICKQGGPGAFIRGICVTRSSACPIVTRQAAGRCHCIQWSANRH